MDKNNLIDKVSNILKNGEKKKEDFKLGIEIEHLIVDQESLRSINFYENNGIESTLKDMLDYGYEGKYENNYLVGLSSEFGDVSLEPGGQIEFSTRPCINLKYIEKVYIDFIDQIKEVLSKKNQILLGIGYHPKSKIKDIPFNPKSRYEFMSKYFEKTGSMAHNMMKGTASIQVAIDYGCEEDFIKKFRVANFLTPIFYLITDNAPIFEGEIYEKNTIRTTIWNNTDQKRSGIVPKSLDIKSYTYRDYGKYIINNEPICVLDNNKNIIPVGSKKVFELDDMNFDLSNEGIEHILTMYFPDVRAKNYIEIRMADSMPHPYSFSYLALIKNIFYNDDILDYYYNMSLNYTNDQINDLKLSIVENGYNAHFNNKLIGEEIDNIFKLIEESPKSCDLNTLKYIKDLVRVRSNLSLEYKPRIKEEEFALKELRL